VRYFLADQQGSTRLLSDAAGTITSSYDYSAFGETLSTNAETAYLYTGQQYDAATAMYSLRARYYAPGAGRFVSRDVWPVDYGDPWELNRYGYVGNNPGNYSDPSGLLAFEFGLVKTTVSTAQGAVMGGLFGAIGGAAFGGIFYMMGVTGLCNDPELEAYFKSIDPISFVQYSAAVGAVMGAAIGGVIGFAAGLAPAGYAAAYGATAGFAASLVGTGAAYLGFEERPSICTLGALVVSLLFTGIAARFAASAITKAAAAQPNTGGNSRPNSNPGVSVGIGGNRPTTNPAGFINDTNPIKVGRWMSLAEFLRMQQTGRVQSSAEGGGYSYVLLDGPDSFYQQAPRGSVYVEFTLPPHSPLQVTNAQLGWARILPPGTTFANAWSRFTGIPITEMPLFSNLMQMSTKP
jgi:RHS repeat-associated protein